MSVRRSRRRSAGDQPESIILEDRTIIDTGNLSPTSPLERDPRSPKSWKRRDSDGVGLGILAALDRTSIGDSPARLIVGNSGRLTVKSDAMGCSTKRCSSEEMGVDCTSPSPRFTGGVSDFREADFLSYCYLCRKRLQGRDIYMYRGEKAFCSMECRYQQIVSDECHEKCASEIVSTSPYFCDGRLFFAGITAA